jgi:hypothetical protein
MHAHFKLFQRRWGLFLHYGLYANGEYHEQEQRNLSWERSAYAEHYLPQFTAEAFDADAIVEFAQRVGMEYLVITTKHHDGFCLWDSVVSTRSRAIRVFVRVYARRQCRGAGPGRSYRQCSRQASRADPHPVRVGSGSLAVLHAVVVGAHQRISGCASGSSTWTWQGV